MLYRKIVEGIFLERPNRFIAKVQVGENIETVHVKNTGRCRELLVKGAKVILEDCESPNRKTRYDLISVYKNGRLINMDSQVPNDVVEEWIKDKNLFDDISYYKREYKFGDSRFDFYIEHGDKKCFVEVKGVTLENDNVVMFPDAPTKRGSKHLMHLIEATKQGYEAAVIFVIQMSDVDYFTPNYERDEEFSKALLQAQNVGVNILAFDCNITENSIEYKEKVQVRF